MARITQVTAALGALILSTCAQWTAPPAAQAFYPRRPQPLLLPVPRLTLIRPAAPRLLDSEAVFVLVEDAASGNRGAPLFGPLPTPTGGAAGLDAGTHPFGEFDPRSRAQRRRPNEPNEAIAWQAYGHDAGAPPSDKFLFGEEESSPGRPSSPSVFEDEEEPEYRPKVWRKYSQEAVTETPEATPAPETVTGPDRESDPVDENPPIDVRSGVTEKSSRFGLRLSVP